MIQRYNKILHHFLLWIQQITCNDTLDALCGRSFMSNILTGGSYYGYQIRCSIILVYIAFHGFSNSITFYKLYRQIIIVKSGLDVLFDICLYGILYHSIIPLSLFLDAIKTFR